MAETTISITQEQITTLHEKLVTTFNFRPIMKSIGDDLAIMQDKTKRLLANNSAYYPILQDLIIDLETAQEAIEDAIQGINDLT